MTQSFIQELQKEKYSKHIIQALISQSSIAINQYVANMQQITKHSDLNRQIDSIVGEWYRIQPTFDVEFPNNFIESAIYSESGEIIKNTFQDLGLKINFKLAGELKKWLYE